MAESIDGKVALVTGASSGIGEATAEALSAAGAKVALVARRKDRIDALAGRLSADGGTAIAIEADVSDEETANAAVNRTNDELGGLDFLINNAGVMLLGPVAGASSGIGEATAEALSAAGAKVALVARRKDRIDALAGRLSADGGTAIAIEADVADEEMANAAVNRASDELGGLDFLINNAGVMLLGPVAGADTEQWRRMIDVNLLGLLYCTHAALPIMGEAGSGHIVNVSSVAGRTASLGSAVYNLTKWGVVGFSEGLRQEVLHANVRVTIIEPGFVETELQGHNEHPVVVEELEKMRNKVDPLQSSDIADAILYAVTRPQHVGINEVMVRPTKQQR